MTKDYILKNADFSIMQPAAAGAAVEAQPQDWTLLGINTTQGGEGVSRVPTDDNRFALYFRVDTITNPQQQVLAYQDWQCPASAPPGQEIALCAEVQQRPRVADAAADAMDVPVMVLLMRYEPVIATLMHWSVFKIGANMSSSTTIRHTFKPTPGVTSRFLLGCPTTNQPGQISVGAFLIKRAWLEIVKAQ
jgi:hypothetical protein